MIKIPNFVRCVLRGEYSFTLNPEEPIYSSAACRSKAALGLVAVISANIERAAAVNEERHAGDEIGLVGDEE